MSKSWRLVTMARKVDEREHGFEADVLDLSREPVLRRQSVVQRRDDIAPREKLLNLREDIGGRVIVRKSPAEIAVMREAGRITAMALRAVGEAVREGVTTGISAADPANIDTSTRWPLPVRSRACIARRIPITACMEPPARSAI